MIRKAGIEDKCVLARLAAKLWEDDDTADLEDEFRELAKRDDAVCFIKYVDDVPYDFDVRPKLYGSDAWDAMK